MNTEKMSAVILAGGNSARMGVNKLLLPLGNSTVLGRVVEILNNMFAECILVTDKPEEFRNLPVRTVSDRITGVPKSSMLGIHGGLCASRNHYSFVVGGDMPFLSPTLIRHLCSLAGETDLVVPREEPHYHPLGAVYSREVIPVIEELLTNRIFKITSLFERVRVKYVDVDELRVFDSELWSFFNVNTPDDYIQAQKHLVDLKERMQHMDIPIVSVVGKSGSGKTVLICGLLPELKKRGYRVGTIKHDVHGFDIDVPGKDSWKHARAGADTVVISSPWKVAKIEKVDRDLSLDEVIARIDNVDLIISEGYKRNNKPKIEVFRSTVNRETLCQKGDNLLAVVSDVQPDLGVPVFALDDYSGIADFIEKNVLKKNRINSV